MKIILMVGDNTAQQIGNIRVEDLIKSEQFSPVLMVLRQRDETSIPGTVPFPLDDHLLEAKAAPGQAADLISVEPFLLYPKMRRAIVRGQEIQLKNREFELLLYLVSHPGQVFTKEHLYETLWGGAAAGDMATIMVHINRLRQKVEEDPANPRYIQTVWGAGYRFRACP